MDEFSIIEQYFSWPTLRSKEVQRSVGDDCAIITPNSNQKLLITTDCLIEGVHFPNNTSPDLVAIKSLAVNLSDIAAMGGEPTWYTLVLGLPSGIEEKWISSFSKSLQEQSRKYQIDLIGGDTVKSEQLFITIQMHGYAANNILQRNKAKAGDLIVVSGQLGAAALGLQLALNKLSKEQFSPEEYQTAIDALNQPQARIELGQIINQYSHCALDISDGLLADLLHILEQSNCGVEIDIDSIPVASCLSSTPKEKALLMALTGGDDYELCFSISPENWIKLQLNKKLSTVCTLIGKITDTKLLKLLQHGKEVEVLDGQPIKRINPGYNHFN